MSIVTIVKNFLIGADEGAEPTVVEIKRHEGLFDITYGYKVKQERDEWGGMGWRSAEDAERKARESARRRR